MSSRDQILSAIRQRPAQVNPLPELTGPWIQYDDVVQQFSEVLASVGGLAHVVEDVSQIASLLPEFQQSGLRVANLVPGAWSLGVEMTQTDDPHAFADLDLAILPGALAVAENAAVWVTDANVPQRVIYFVCQHLALVVPLRQLVHNLHQAYAQISVDARPFGCFISGPSKTADIEQSLVKGAHGARTLNVFLVRNPSC